MCNAYGTGRLSGLYIFYTGDPDDERNFLLSRARLNNIRNTDSKKKLKEEEGKRKNEDDTSETPAVSRQCYARILFPRDNVMRTSPGQWKPCGRRSLVVVYRVANFKVTFTRGRVRF